MCFCSKLFPSPWLNPLTTTPSLFATAAWCTACTDTDWKIIYVGSADSEEHDQELESVVVGPVNVGRNQFVFEVCVTSWPLPAKQRAFMALQGPHILAHPHHTHGHTDTPTPSLAHSLTHSFTHSLMLSCLFCFFFFLFLGCALQADGPDPTQIPVQELRGVTAVILTCSYLDQEFVRIGYYVNVYYDDPEL